MARGKTEPGQFLIDGISTLDAGMDAGVAPQLLKSNQAAFITNGTARGGYLSQRPAVREIALDFKGDDVAKALATTTAFQAACFYQPDTGPETLVAAIGGHLFQFAPNGTVATVLDVSVPNDPNPAYPQSAWLWQFERFVAWTDGVSLPVFFDGTSSRRSNGIGKVLATILGSFAAPAVGATVTVTITGPYTGPINIPVLVNGSQFTLLGTATSNPTAEVVALYAPLPSYGAGAVFVSYPNRLGVCTSGTVGGSGIIQAEITVVVFDPMPVGQFFQMGGEMFKVLSKIDDTHYVVQNVVPGIFGNGFIAGYLVGHPFPTVPAGSIMSVSSSLPTPIIATLTAPFATSFTTPTPVVVNPAFTLPAQNVWIGTSNAMFKISPLTSPPSTSLVLQNVSATPGDPMTGDIIALPELPPGRMGTYGLGRNWMALTDATSFIASDIVGGTSGTQPYAFRDAPMRVVENTYLSGGGSFKVPGALGNIRAMRFPATLDASLGQGPLQVMTTQAAFSCAAPIDRLTWGMITNPILTQSLLGAGALSQNGAIMQNGDIIFRAIDGIRSLILARRDFDTWGNVPQSREVQAILSKDNPSLVQFESGAVFDNRFLLTCLPTQGPLGVFHQGIIALNTDPISNLRGKAPSIYDGLWTGLNVLQLVQGSFSGVDRCYAFCYDSILSRIRLFEILKEEDTHFDNSNIPITYSFESASLFTNPKIKGEFELCELQDGELYVSDIRGVVNFEVFYRPNYSQCWQKWVSFGVCGNNTDPNKATQYRSPLGFGSPSVKDCDPNTKMPTRIGLNFQIRIQVTGSCKIRGAKFKAVPVPETKYSVPICKPLCDAITDATQECESCVDQNPCLQFPLVVYNLNANKTYQNDLASVKVACPDGSVQTVVVPAGTIAYTLPFSPGFSGDYPPLVMNCLSGGVIVKTIPSGATQDQIDLVVNEMIAQCVTAYAQSIAQCGVKTFASEQVMVEHSCAEGTTLAFTGTLPSWITIDTGTSTVIGAAGAVSSEVSIADATAKAQAQLQAFVTAQLSSGNLHCSSPVACICLDSSFSVPGAAGFPDNNVTGTKDSTARRLVVGFSADSLTFVNTQTNAVIVNTPWDGIFFGVSGELGCFAKSSQSFYFPSSDGVSVFSKDGAHITDVALPGDLLPGSLTNLIYSPEQDTVYGMALSSGSGSRFFFSVNPNTNTSTLLADTGSNGQGHLYYTPNRIIIAYPGFQLVSFGLPALGMENTLALNTFDSDYAYAANTGKLFVPINTFAAPVSFVQIDPATLMIEKTYTTATINGLLTFWQYNPVTGVVVGSSLSRSVVVDPVAQSIVCELETSVDFENAGLVADYSSGDIYSFVADGGTNPMSVYKPCP